MHLDGGGNFGSGGTRPVGGPRESRGLAEGEVGSESPASKASDDFIVFA